MEQIDASVQRSKIFEEVRRDCEIPPGLGRGDSLVFTIHVELVAGVTIPSSMPLDVFYNLVDRIRRRGAIARHGTKVASIVVFVEGTFYCPCESGSSIQLKMSDNS